MRFFIFRSLFASSFLVFFWTLNPLLSKAEEMDHFSDRLFMLNHLKDAKDIKKSILDQEVRRLINQMIQNLNKEDSVTSKELKTELEEQAIKAFLHPFPYLRDLITPMANWIVHEAPIPVFYPTSRGIYGWDVNYSNMFMAWYVKLVPILKLHGVLQGTDKIGHFFGQGWMYYEYFEGLKHQAKTASLSTKEKLEKLRHFGHLTEMGALGFATGGVYSYADLASNWQGFTFFRELIDLKHPQAYLETKDGKLRIKRLFSWKDYVTDDWDEVINPSRLRDQASFDKVKKNFHRPKINGKSVCQEYKRNPKAYLNKQGKRLPPPLYLWQKIRHQQKSYFIDIKKICKR